MAAQGARHAVGVDVDAGSQESPVPNVAGARISNRDSDSEARAGLVS